MSRLQRVLAPLSVAVGLAAFAPSAMAGTTVTFPDGGPVETTVTITDPGPAVPTVHLTVTAATPSDLVNTKVILGRGQYAFSVIDAVGVHEVADEFEDLFQNNCAVYPSATRDDVQVTVGASTFTADLPKGEVISFEEADVAAVVAGPSTDCTRAGLAGIAFDFMTDAQEIDGFAWNDPATPVVTATDGRRQFTLAFAQEAGTDYEVWRVVNGVREGPDAFRYLDGVTGKTQEVIDMDTEGNRLPAGTQYALQVRAVRRFHPSNGDPEPSSAFTDVNVATNPIQTLQFTATPAASTTARTADFSWSLSGSLPGEVPVCWVDVDYPTGFEVPCTATGASLSGLALGAHMLSVYPGDGEAVYNASWTVVDAPVTPTPPAPPAAPVAPKNQADLDGDGIDNTWLVNGKPAAAPKTAKATVTSSGVKLKLAAAPKGAKSIRVYRADGKGGYKLVKTLKPRSKGFTDTKVKSGHTYKYKTVAVNAKGQQGKASGTTTAKVKKKK